MSKIKVLEVIRQGQIGGGESHLLDLVSFFDKQEVEPICLSFTDGEMVLRLREMGVPCHVIDSQKPFDPLVQKQVLKLIQDIKIQIVHAHGSRAASNIIYPTKKMNLPFVYTVHGWSYHDDQPWMIRKMRSLSEKVICHFANQVICVSHSNLESGRYTFGLKNAKVIENGVNLDRFNPNFCYKDLRKEFGFEQSDFVVGFIARCTKQKNPILFLESIRQAHFQHPSIKGLFVGEGDLDAEVDTYIMQKQMQDYVFRSKFRTDVPELLNCIDVYCLPSLWEGLSIALLEAMAMRKAIVATPTDGTREVIRQEENGLIVPICDIDATAAAFVRFFENRSLKKQCEDSASFLIRERFNAEKVSASVQNIYRKLYYTI